MLKISIELFGFSYSIMSTDLTFLGSAFGLVIYNINNELIILLHWRHP